MDAETLKKAAPPALAIAALALLGWMLSGGVRMHTGPSEPAPEPRRARRAAGATTGKDVIQTVSPRSVDALKSRARRNAARTADRLEQVAP